LLFFNTNSLFFHGVFFSLLGDYAIQIMKKSKNFLVSGLTEKNTELKFFNFQKNYEEKEGNYQITGCAA
jgi:hypothetical protein